MIYKVNQTEVKHALIQILGDRFPHLSEIKRYPKSYLIALMGTVFSDSVDGVYLIDDFTYDEASNLVVMVEHSLTTVMNSISHYSMVLDDEKLIIYFETGLKPENWDFKQQDKISIQNYWLNGRLTRLVERMFSP